MRVLVLLSALLMLPQPCAFAAEPEGNGDAQKAVTYAGALETDPLASDAKEKRQWLMHWLTSTKDYDVTVCEIFGPTLREDIPYSPELMAQQMFGNVAYQISNPGVHDEVAKQVAGMQSLLKAYAAILARDAKAHIPYYDSLLDMRAKGSLNEYLTPVIQKACIKKA